MRRLLVATAVAAAVTTTAPATARTHSGYCTVSTDGARPSGTGTPSGETCLVVLAVYLIGRRRPHRA